MHMWLLTCWFVICLAGGPIFEFWLQRRYTHDPETPEDS